MKNILLMGVFAMFMTIAWGGQSVSSLSFVTLAAASAHDDSVAAVKQADDDALVAATAKSDYEMKQQAYEKAQAKAEKSGEEEDKHAAEEAKTLADAAETLANDDDIKAKASQKLAENAKALENAFHCPGGLTSCFRADGSEYTDVNNFQATAAGGDDDYAAIQVARPQHFRSF